MKLSQEIHGIKKLNVGCGFYKKAGYLNIDNQEKTNPDLLHDLNIFPYPFETNYFDHIEASHVLEHLEDPWKIMKEFHRILKENGTLIVKVPHCSRGFSHPDHRHGFDVSLPLFFDKSSKIFFTGTDFKIVKTVLRWSGQPELKKDTLPFPLFCIGVILGFVFDFFANISVYCCSKIWCYWVGGFDEIEFHFICNKTIS